MQSGRTAAYCTGQELEYNSRFPMQGGNRSVNHSSAVPLGSLLQQSEGEESKLLKLFDGLTELRSLKMQGSKAGIQDLALQQVLSLSLCSQLPT